MEKCLGGESKALLKVDFEQHRTIMLFAHMISLLQFMRVIEKLTNKY